MNRFLIALIGVTFLAVVPAASGACTNKYLIRSGSANIHKHEVTLLTGMITFQEAQALSRAIDEKKAPGIEWLDDRKRSIAAQLGKLTVIRPMPVSCGEKTSGVVMSFVFMSFNPPTTKMTLKLTPTLTVDFDRQ